MSSNRHALPCEAYVQREDDAVGPMRLPLKNPEGFIEHFNSVYAAMGLRILPVDGVIVREKTIDKEIVREEDSSDEA